MRLRLVLPDREVDLGPGDVVLGRDPSCDVVVADRTVSRRHAQIAVGSQAVVLRDLGSRNGTWVNGLKIGSDRRLRPGDRILLGVCALRVARIVDDDVRDDGWLAIQAALLVKESTLGRTREADEIVFRIAEAMDLRVSEERSFGSDVSDTALAAVIDYAGARNRPGWTRWAMAMHAKLGLPLGPAVQRALSADDARALRSSGTVPRPRAAAGRRKVG